MLQTVWDDLYNLQLKIWVANWELLKMQQELMQSELRLKIQDKKKEISDMENAIDDKRDYIMRKLQEQGIKSIEFTNQKVTLKKSPWSVKVIDENEIPDNYFKEKVSKQLDKKMLKEWLAMWDVVPWAKIEYTYSLLFTAK